MRSTNLEYQQRVEEILSLRLQGVEWCGLCQFAASRGWSVSPRQIRRYIRAGDQLLARTLENDREKLINQHRATRRMLLTKANQLNDVRAALAVVIDEAKLLGLYAPSKTEVSGNVQVEDLRSIPDGELRARIAEYEKRLPAPPERAESPASPG
jgi:hypothetical protein